MTNRVKLGDAAWGCLRAITLLLKTLFVLLFEVVDGVVTRRGRHVVGDERPRETQANVRLLTYEQRLKNGEFICPSCDDY
ncbi:hypothetical protein M758_UG253900 [Ceratodon purpureus]|nr:hypothetical protein M758_UG253900 [Ceratodon purpureus]